MEKNFINKIKEIGKGILTIILFFFLPSFIIPFFRNPIKSNNFWIRNLSFIAFESILVFIFIILYRKRLQKDFKDWKKNYKKYLKEIIPIWLISLGLMIISNILINAIITNGNIATNEESNREIMKSYPIYAIFGMILEGPILEEITFRLSFKKAFKNIILFALFTGILFGSVHVLNTFDSINSLKENYQQLFFILPYSFVGIGLSYAYAHTDNIMSSITLHIIHNTLSVGLVFLTYLLQYLT